MAALMAALGACEKQDAGAPPVPPSSADQITYAEEYSDQMERVQQRIGDGGAEVTEKSGQFAGYADQIKEPSDWDVYRQVVEAADDSGQSAAYAERARENEAVMDMLEENDGEIRKKVASGVSYAAKQGGCSSDLGGAAAGAMKRAFEKRMQDRLEERNEAYRIIERHEETIGKPNVPTMQKQADDIARSSYVANVQLPTERAKLQRLIDERSEVSATIDDKIQEEKDFQAGAGVSDKAKEASNKRIAEMEEAKTALQNAQIYDAQQLADLDQQIQAFQDAHRKGLDELLAKIGDKASSAPPVEAEASATVN